MPDHHRYCIRNKIVAHQQCFIQKVLPYRIPRYFDLDIDEQIRRSDLKIQTAVDDGGMICAPVNTQNHHRFATVLQYSLNKHKRWTLPDLLEEAILSDELATSSPELNVSYIKIQSTWGDFMYAQRSGVLYLSSTALGSVKHVDPVSHSSSVSDLIGKGLAESARWKASEDEEETLAQRVRSTDLGVLYVFSVPDHDHSKHAKRGKYKRVTGIRSIWRWERSIRSEKRKAEDCAAVPYDYEETEDLEEQPETEATSPRRTFDLEELMVAVNVPVKRRRSMFRTSRTSSGSDLKDKKVFVDTADEAGPVSETTDRSLLVSDFVKMNAVRNSCRRTFRFAYQSLWDVDKLINDYRNEDILISASASWLDESVPRVIFADLGLDIAVCFVFHHTMFGLECVVKGPERWLDSLDEHSSTESLLRSLLVAPTLPPKIEVTWMEKILTTEYASVSTVPFSASFLEIPRNDLAWNRVEDACPICCDFTGLVSNVCGHHACSDCWSSYIIANVLDGNSCLRCPAAQCKVLVCPSLIATLAPGIILRSWQSRQMDAVLLKSARPVVRCSTPECMFLFVFEDSVEMEKQPLVQCRRCRSKMCTCCRKAWHWPCSCKEAERYRSILHSKGDDQLRDLGPPCTYVAQTKKCPGCRHPMEKSSGCPHMKCICGMDFCWICTKPWQDHYNRENEWQNCTERQLESIDIEEDIKLLWREQAYKEAVKMRVKRFELKRARWKPPKQSALFHGYHILEFIYALFSQSSSAKFRGEVKQDVSRLRFLLQLLEENDTTTRSFSFSLDDSITKQIACLRFYFKCM